jgi:hypothetical protein
MRFPCWLAARIALCPTPQSLVLPAESGAETVRAQIAFGPADGTARIIIEALRESSTRFWCRPSALRIATSPER